MREDGAEETPGSEFSPVTMEVAHENTDPGILGGTGLLQGDHLEILINSWSLRGKGSWGPTFHYLLLFPSPSSPLLYPQKSRTRVGK